MTNVAAPFQLTGKTPRCEVCDAPLPALRAMLRSVCTRPACLQHETQAQRRSERKENDVALRRSLQAQIPVERAKEMPVVWLEPHDVRITELPPDLRRNQTDYLRSLVRSADIAPAEAEPAGAPPARRETQACTWCQGRCCRFGLANHGFIEARHLRRWQMSHPGSSLDDAAAAYVERLPDRHAEGSCFYHGEHGCTLPREMRSSICNKYSCDALEEVQVLCRDDHEREMVLVMGEREVEAAMRADADGLHPLVPRYILAGF